MRRRHSTGLKPEALAAYLEGEVTSSERVTIERELRDSPECRRRLAQLKELSYALSAPIAELESIDIASRVSAALREPHNAPSRRGHPFLGWSSAAIAAIAMLAVLVVRQTPLDEFRAKTTGNLTNERARWTGIQVQRWSSGSPLSPLSTPISRSDELIFSYVNGGQHPFKYLMIFSVDATHNVLWFYPAYETAGTNPLSVPIAGSQQHLALPDSIQHDFDPGRLVIYALFTDSPLSVAQVETLIREQGGALTVSSVSGSSLQSIETQVRP